MTNKTYSNQQIAKVIIKKFGPKDIKFGNVKMLYTKEVNAYNKMVRTAENFKALNDTTLYN
ncbi:MAG: hypothetical protein WCS73_10080 [Lentisphaeria bacterium]